MIENHEMFVFQMVFNPFDSMDKNYILAFEDNPFPSRDFRMDDAGIRAQKLDQKTSNDFTV